MNCQKCRTPLKLHPSLDTLNPAAFDLLIGKDPAPPTFPSVLPYPSERNEIHDQAASQNAGAHHAKRTTPIPRRGIQPITTPSVSRAVSMKDSTAMSFVMLTDSQLEPPPPPSPTKQQRGKGDTPLKTSGPKVEQQSLSSRADLNARLFEILSSRSDIDHPVCNECTELLLTSFRAKLSATTKERDAYIAFLKELNRSVPTEAEVLKAEAELADSRAAEVKAFDELLALEDEKRKLQYELADLDREATELDGQEEAYWRERNAFEVRVSSLREERDALEASYAHDAGQLERLQRTNVYNDTFCIGHDGHFGTINGLRLGRLAMPNHVDWPEINAAWGTAALLLKTVADKLGYAFRGYAIKPMGSTSHIDKVESTAAGSTASSAAAARMASHAGREALPKPKVINLELFSSGDLPLARTLLHRRFNDAMVAFLECLSQLGSFVEKTDAKARGGGESGLRLPYAIERDRINGVSIKLGVSQDEQWTSACKYALTCCKFLLAHASNVAVRAGK